MCAGGCRALPRSRFRNRSSTELRNPRRGGLAEGKTKVLAGWFAGEFCPALRSRRPFRLADGVPARQIPSKARYLAPSRGGGRRAEPGLRTSRQEKPAAAAAKNRPRRGRSGIKEGLFRRTAFCLKKSEKFSFAQKRPPRVVGVRRFYESISWEKKERPTNLARPSSARRKVFCRETNIGGVHQKRSKK